MAKRSWFANKARRSLWSVHVEAWHRSGVSQREYCKRHRLCANTFRRWRIELDRPLRARVERVKKRRIAWSPRGKAVRTKALVAFWSMHVEALQWSGLGARDYAHVHHLSLHSLRHWRRQLDLDPPAMDWREMLHPSARPRPKLSSGASSAANEPPSETVPIEAPAPEPHGDRRSNRRSFTDAEKLAIVLEAERPGVSAAAVCRRHDIVTSMLFRWRVQLGFGQDERAKLATVRLAGRRGRGRPKQSDVLVLDDLLQPPEGSIAIELGDGRRVFAPAGSDPDTVRRYVAERENAP